MNMVQYGTQVVSQGKHEKDELVRELPDCVHLIPKKNFSTLAAARCLGGENRNPHLAFWQAGFPNLVSAYCLPCSSPDWPPKNLRELAQQSAVAMLEGVCLNCLKNESLITLEFYMAERLQGLGGSLGKTLPKPNLNHFFGLRDRFLRFAVYLSA